MKRTFDLILAAMLLTLISPLLLLTAAAIRLDSPGLAQATLRSAATPEQRKEMDLRYARTASLAQDLSIILMTVKQVLLKGGN